MNPPQKKRKILFVEDELNMRFFLKTFLETNGFLPLMAKNGREGIQIAGKEKPDLIILDVMMPEQGGALTYTSLQREEELSDIPVIILSGVEKRAFFHYLDMTNANTGENIPYPEAYVQKPPEPDHLLDLIENILK